MDLPVPFRFRNGVLLYALLICDINILSAHAARLFSCGTWPVKQPSRRRLWTLFTEPQTPPIHRQTPSFTHIITHTICTCQFHSILTCKRHSYAYTVHILWNHVYGYWIWTSPHPQAGSYVLPLLKPLAQWGQKPNTLFFLKWKQNSNKRCFQKWTSFAPTCPTPE